MASVMPHRIFLLSPAYAGGQRARMIMSERAKFPLAEKLRQEGATSRRGFYFSERTLFSRKNRLCACFRVRRGR